MKWDIIKSNNNIDKIIYNQRMFINQNNIYDIEKLNNELGQILLKIKYNSFKDFLDNASFYKLTLCLLAIPGVFASLFVYYDSNSIITSLFFLLITFAVVAIITYLKYKNIKYKIIFFGSGIRIFQQKSFYVYTYDHIGSYKILETNNLLINVKLEKKSEVTFIPEQYKIKNLSLDDINSLNNIFKNKNISIAP
jgi:hypothetical protein